MSWRSRVVWSEGMFLRPHHFQQHDRYLETLLEARAAPLRRHAWGVVELKIDGGLLSQGRLAVSVARGLFPDGTPFDIPTEASSPEPLAVTESMRGGVVHLAMALRREQVVESGPLEERRRPLRYHIAEQEVCDSTVGGDTSATLQVGTSALRLVPDGEPRDGFTSIGVARIADVAADGKVRLDDGFMPPALSCTALPRLAELLNDLLGLLGHRAEALAARVSAGGHASGVSDIADFMMLQCVNRYHAMIGHLAALPGVHPEEFYIAALQIAGELASFSTAEKRIAELPRYRHDDLRGCFEAVMAPIRSALSRVIAGNAVELKLTMGNYGIRVAQINDRRLLADADFVLAVRADLPAEQVRNSFPGQLKIGPVEQIGKLVNLHLGGIPLRSLAVAPREIPFHSGYSYFQLESGGELWKQLNTSGGFAFHAGGDFPGLKMEFWAIRRLP